VLAQVQYERELGATLIIRLLSVRGNGTRNVLGVVRVRAHLCAPPVYESVSVSAKLASHQLPKVCIQKGYPRETPDFQGFL